MDLPISDIFDGLQDSSVDLQCRSYASAQKVRALTLEKIHQQVRPAPQRRRFRLPMLAAAALLAAALAVTAIATDGFGIADWFRDIFGNMTQQEQQAAEGLAMDGQTPVAVTANGTTVTLVSAIGDARNCYARIRLEAPVGTRLPRVQGNDSLALQSAPKPPDYISSSILTCPDLVSSRGFPFFQDIAWTDTVPGDNVLEAVIRIGLPQDSRVNFTDDHPDYLNFSGLYRLEGIASSQEEILKGPWELPLAPMGGETRELDVLGQKCRFQVGDADYSLTLRRMTISPMGIEVDVTYDTPVAGEASFTYPTATAFTMDGTAVKGTISYDRMFQLEDQICSYSYIFDAPIALEDIDSLVFCDLMLPISGDGSQASLPEASIVGTHVKLGDPGSLRTGEDMMKPEEITAALTGEDYFRAASYAEYTDKGIQLIRPVGEGSGRLIYTLTDARLITDLSQIGGNLDGFGPETYYVSGDAGWDTGDRPTGINTDGSFQKGYRLILLDAAVTNDHVKQSKESISPNNPSLNGFNTSGLFYLASIENKDTANYSYITSNYFMEEGGKWVNYFELAPGQTKDVTVGFWLSPDTDWDLSMIRAANCSGWEHGVFIDLDLVP